MEKFQHRQEEHELSIASLARLSFLLKTCRVGSVLQDIGLPESKRLLKPNLRLRRDQFRPEPLVILPKHEKEARELMIAIGEVLHEIADRLDIEWRSGPVGINEGADRRRDSAWAIGDVTFCVEQLPILRGEVELRKTEPIAARIPDVVVEFLVSVPGTRDQIIREIHGHWGYHYHYVDKKGRRSDTLLTFDRTSKCVANPNLCWERHAEGDKFKARAEAWRSDKRQSVYSVCHPHASSLGLSAFKRPASDAEIVWPLAVAVAAKSAV